MFRRSLRIAVTALVVGVFALTASSATAHPGHVLYDPNPETNPDDKASYEHAIRLDDGSILATFERQLANSTNPGRGWLIYRSTDNGETFEQVARVEPHELPNATNALQPALVQLHQDTGNLKAGTVILSTETGQDGGLDVQLFTSTDRGETWNYLSTPEATHPDTDGERRIWEPFTVQLDDGRLVVYYSDEIVPGREQNIVYKVSEDGGQTWGEPVDVWNPTGADDRPGMSTVARMGNGRYIMTVEFCGNQNAPVDYCRIRYKTSDDGLQWGDPADWGTRPVAAGSGHVLHGNPSVTWTPSGGPNGMVIVTSGAMIDSLEDPFTEAGGHGQTFLVNYDNGEGDWFELTAPMAFVPGGYQSGYRSAVLPLDGDRLLFFTSSHNGNADQNRIVYGGAGTGALPYENVFADGTDLGWDTFEGEWSVNSNGVYSNAGTTGKSVTGTSALTDYTVSGSVRLDGEGNAGLLLRTTNPDNGVDAHDGYYVGLSSTEDGVFLGRQQHDWQLLGQVHALPGGVDAGSWYDITASVQGCTFSISAQPSGGGEATSFEHTDTGCLGFGQAGVRNADTPASWRNLSVS